MFRRLDNDSLLQIALELVSDSRATLIPFIQSNRHLYNLASHYLLLGTSNDPFTHVHVDLEGNTKMDECVEGFRDFVLGVTSYRSRIRHLRKLLLTTPSQEEIMDLEHPRLSTRAIAALTEIFNPAPSYKSAVSMDLPVLEIFAMDPEPLAMLDNTLPLAEALFKLTTIKEMVYTTCWTSNIIRLHQEIKAPLHKLSINIDDPLTHSYKDNLLLYLAPLRNSLRDLRLDFRERPTFDIVKGTSSPSFLLMSVLHIQALNFRIPTKVLALAFPNLSELVLQIEKSVYPFDDTSHDEDPVWGMPPEDSYYQTLRRDNHKDGTTLWKGLDILQGSVRTVYSLGLTCQVKTLRLLSDGLDDDVMAREVCSTVQPQTLHLACGLPCAVLLATSTIMGSSVSLTNFYLETALSVEVCDETCWETTRDTIVSTVPDVTENQADFGGNRQDYFPNCVPSYQRQMPKPSTFSYA